ncbi:pilin [Candidatus Avelusimicrobium alvi]|uniref:pilin n=1 Tax=Candidatus Avelusimicrobium alvi TaxID=3416221 RepID=UPI003D0E0649
MKKGFTLIELLVVVLIIGILSAVALPQYEKAVEKSRASEALMMLKTLREQQAVCMLSHGDDGTCGQGNGAGDNLFTVADVELKGEVSSACEEPLCGPATKNFSYYLDGQYIGAERRPEYTKYALETTALFQNTEKAFNRIICFNSDNSKDYCKMIGFKKDGNTYVQP